MADHYPSGCHGEDLISRLIETHPQSEGVTTGKFLYQFTWIFFIIAITQTLPEVQWSLVKILFNKKVNYKLHHITLFLEL